MLADLAFQRNCINTVIRREVIMRQVHQPIQVAPPADRAARD
jgi:hypothetical protein